MGSRWIFRPEILDYIIDSYAGVEGRRRVFIWEDGDAIKMGNAEAFALHLADRFELLPDTGRASQIHGLLRELGEKVNSYPEKRSKPTPGVGTFSQPEPEEWVIAKKKVE